MIAFSDHFKLVYAEMNCDFPAYSRVMLAFIFEKGSEADAVRTQTTSQETGKY